MGICDECIIKDGCKFANSGLIMKHCKNFIGEAPREIKTNFQRISASPEALADFISKATISAWFAQANSELPNPNGSKQWLAWLKQESDTE